MASKMLPYTHGPKRAVRTKVVDLDAMKHGKVPVARKPTKAEAKKIAAFKRAAKK